MMISLLGLFLGAVALQADESARIAIDSMPMTLASATGISPLATSSRRVRSDTARTPVFVGVISPVAGS